MPEKLPTISLDAVIEQMILNDKRFSRYLEVKLSIHIEKKRFSKLTTLAGGSSMGGVMDGWYERHLNKLRVLEQDCNALVTDLKHDYPLHFEPFADKKYVQLLELNFQRWCNTETELWLADKLNCCSCKYGMPKGDVLAWCQKFKDAPPLFIEKCPSYEKETRSPEELFNDPS